jgi:Ca2+-binding EF-hand superfamily protein
MKINRLFAWTMGGGLLLGTALATMTLSGQKTASNESVAKHWLTAMDPDNDGTVSKQEFTTYMEAQFDKADPDHDGTLDQKELEQLRKNLRIAEKH